MFGFIPSEEGGSVAHQLCAHLRGSIASGALAPGLRLPPTRKVSQELRMARNLVIEVYEQLVAEGYLTARVGSGTFIAEGIRLEPSIRQQPEQTAVADVSSPSVLQRPDLIDFDAGAPDVRLFPRRLWTKYMKEIMDYGTDPTFDYGDCLGHPGLRAQIARYVFRAKGIRCSEDQIVVTAGTADGLILLASALSPEVRHAYIEDPTIGFVPEVLSRLPYNLTRVPVDGHGMEVDRIPPSAAAGLIVLTPSHQYPTGSILSIQRRQLAIQLAEAAGHYLLEDDYDSEFRHYGGPVPPLWQLSPDRVVYAGTFSKTLSPALRIGFLIVPPPLLDRVVMTKIGMHLTASGLTQAALARLIEDGHYDRHIHRMKTIYRKRRLFLVEQCRRLFGDRVRLLGDEAGMHVRIAFEDPRLARIDWRQSAAHGIHVGTVDDYSAVQGRFAGNLVLGYGRLTEVEIGEGLCRLHDFVRSQTS
ncbi:PLP-dependent aminotransferase family protein [Cohnella sp. REN36]|uniref:MocR-like pyridoxine biosynthesis transcription factor PdxR n=1 Tax=Cohnella sp. REN36 TaxID=2887347 RepID=UPI001D136210|nr:PLP-dependent aminotransferase family protein [Cohnella sp. REN36]MCC3371469.1 PLP-dependent aminotransferase family protein [Cohnella sp. REN36]